MSLRGYDHITNHKGMIITDHVHWRKQAYRNFAEILKIILLFSCPEEPRCLFCDKLSLKYTSLASLASHYKYDHKQKTVNYYLKKIIKIPHEKMEKLYDLKTKQEVAIAIEREIKN